MTRYLEVFLIYHENCLSAKRKKDNSDYSFSLTTPYLILPIGGARYGHKKILGLTLFVLAWSESTNNHVTLLYIMLSFQGNQVVNPPYS